MEELIKLAEEKGYKSSFMCTTPMKYSTKENIRKLFIMVEIQKWLRDIYSIEINLRYRGNDERYYIEGGSRLMGISFGNELDRISFSTYEEALKVGLIKALQMIGGKIS